MTLLIFFLISALILCAYYVRKKVRKKGLKPEPEIFSVPVPEANLFGVRYRFNGKPAALLIHGYGGNSRNWREMGYALHALGYDVWMPNLRGHGKGSHRSHVFGGNENYGFDGIALYDVPALVEHVFNATRKPVFLIGHSMGGIAIRAFLAGLKKDAGRTTEADPGLARALSQKVSGAAIIGSPAHFGNVTLALKSLMMQPSVLVEWLVKSVPVLDSGRAPTQTDREHTVFRLRRKAVTQFFWGLRGLPALKGVVEIKNFSVAKQEFSRLIEKGVSKVSAELLRDFRRWIQEGICTSRDGFDYSAERAVFVPLLFIAGDLDQVAPYQDIFELAERYKKMTRVWKILFRRTSHVDLIAGERAATHLAPLLNHFYREAESVGPENKVIEVG